MTQNFPKGWHSKAFIFHAFIWYNWYAIFWILFVLLSSTVDINKKNEMKINSFTNIKSGHWNIFVICCWTKNIPNAGNRMFTMATEFYVKKKQTFHNLAYNYNLQFESTNLLYRIYPTTICQFSEIWRLT